MSNVVRRVAGAGSLLLALLFFGAVVRDLDLRTRGSAAVDLLPLWLGAHALADGRDPTDAAVLKETYEALDPPIRVAGFHTYYPPTASLLARPLGALPFGEAATVVRVSAVLALLGTAALVVAAAPARSHTHAAVATVALAGMFLSVRTAWTVLSSGQIGPVIVFTTALVLAALARGRDHAAGVALALGAGIKLFPLVLLPALLGRPRVLVAAVVTLAALAGGVALHAPDLEITAWVARLGGFVNQGVHPVWLREEPAWMLRLWQARFLALGIPSFLAMAWAWRRRSEPEVAVATAALFAAWGGTVMAGSHHYHEALVLLPAVGWVLVWPAQRGPRVVSWVVGLALLALIQAVGARSRGVGANSLHWVLIGYATWLGCAARLAWLAASRAGSDPAICYFRREMANSRV